MARKTPEVNASSMADIAFLLLIFFLVTTTMDVDSGIFRRLPQMQPEDAVPPKIAERNLLQVLVNMHNTLLVGGEEMQISALKEKTIEFITNPARSSNLPQYETKDIPLFGPIEVSKGIVSLRCDRVTSYEVYLAVQDELTSAFTFVRNQASNDKWGKKL